MKQAILITAYTNYSHLEEIINFFDDEGFSIYIHYDNKSKVSLKEISSLKTQKVVKHFSRKFKVNWGSFNHLRCILHLAEEALKDDENTYFHLISGHDFPAKSKIYFKEYFSQNLSNNYLNNFEVPKEGWADNGGLDRLEYYNFYDLLNAKKPEQKYRLRKIFRLQKKIGFKRAFPKKFPKLYGGSTWWSLNRTCLQYVIDYTKKNKRFLNRFKFTLCSEEFYFQTVIMNSTLKESVKNNSLRYIDWNARNGNNPSVLDSSDLSRLKNHDFIFARKFEYPVSKDLLQILKKSIT